MPKLSQQIGGCRQTFLGKPSRQLAQECTVNISNLVPTRLSFSAQAQQNRPAISRVRNLINPFGIRQAPQRLVNVLAADRVFPGQLGQRDRLPFPSQKLQKCPFPGLNAEGLQLSISGRR